MAQPTIFLNSQQFHQIYRCCFDDLNPCDRLTIRNDNLYRGVQKELPNLILADSEEKMLSSAKKIRVLFCEHDGPGMLKQFQSFSEPVKNGPQFWGCFAPSLPIDSKPIQNLILNRFKNLPEDFKTVFSTKSMDWNEKSVKVCLDDAEFFIKKEKKVQNSLQEALKAKQNEIHYVQQGQEMQEDYLNSVGNLNIFSDKSIDEVTKKLPHIGQQMKDMRTYWVDEARAGRLVMETCRFVQLGPFSYRTERIASEKNILNYAEGYKRTMQFLVYHEMVSGNIHSLEQAFTFVNDQLQTNTLFLSAYTILGQFSSALPMGCQLAIADKFKELLPATEKTKLAMQKLQQTFSNNQ